MIGSPAKQAILATPARFAKPGKRNRPASFSNPGRRAARHRSGSSGGRRLGPGAVTVCRALSFGRAGLALGLLLRPRRLAAAAGFGGRPPAAWLVRLLGTRMLAQSGLELARTTRQVLRAGAAVDALHAASMLAVAARRAGYRRGALVSAAVAAASAAATLASTGRQA